MTDQPDICDLCGLANPAGRTVTHRIGDKTYRFCCPGCRQVFIMLMESADSPDPVAFKESDLFKQCRAMGLIPLDAADLENRLQAGPAPEPAPVAPAGAGGESAQSTDDAHLLELTLKVGDMWCPACAWVIEESLRRAEGIAAATCNFSIDRVHCRYDPVKTSPARISAAIDRLGYRAASADEDPPGRHRDFIRFSIAAFFTMNVMMLSFALYTGFFTTFSPETIYKLSWPIFAMATLVVFYGGQGLIKKALAGLAAASFGMETLIMAGALTAYGFSTVNLLAGSIHLYYDTASMLVTLALLGKWLEKRAKNRVLADLETFFALQPTKVKLCTPQYPRGRYADIHQLQPGGLFQVSESEILPADGRVASGKGTVNEAALTGESRPLGVRPGDRVRAGTRVVSGNFQVQADSVGEQSTLGQMITIMQRALGEKSPLEGRTDRVLQWFVPTIIALAAGTGLACKLSGLPTADAIIRAVTVMVISCPCALGVAIPLARVAGISLAGRKGILVRAFTGFEQAPGVDTLVFDKTGTLTRGRWELLDVVPYGACAPEDALALAAGLESGSEHYIGAEILRRAAVRHLTLPEVSGRQTFENGISGQLGADRIKIGSATFLAGELADIDLEALRSRYARDTLPSLVFLGKNEKLWAVLVFGDKVRSAAGRTLAALTDTGYTAWLISGDEERTTRRVADLIGIEKAAGEKLPAEKAAFLAGLQAQGHRVAMIGDGINDAPALVQADLSMAVHSGNHLGHDVADVTLMRGDPAQVRDFFNLARPVNRTISQNLGCAFAYNLIAIPIAMSGLLSPLVAVTTMLLSSLTVIGNTLRLLKTGETRNSNLSSSI